MVYGHIKMRVEHPKRNEKTYGVIDIYKNTVHFLIEIHDLRVTLSKHFQILISSN